MSRAPLRVIVVDDHDLFRAGLAAILNAADGIEVVGQAAGGRRATILADELAPDVVLMDINMPDMNGIDATRDIVRRHPDMAIAMLSMFADAGTGARATAAGARGFLLKGAPREEILQLVRSIGDRHPAPENPVT
jgi:DNA-binding NarL/FixJ family response regulator